MTELGGRLTALSGSLGLEGGPMPQLVGLPPVRLFVDLSPCEPLPQDRLRIVLGTGRDRGLPGRRAGR
jgi:hypothetical protein